MTRPDPLVAADVDLTDFPFMPLQIARLRRSKAWLKAKRNPALAFYMINLWTAAWHDKPAGSLENDDDVLADFAMCEPAKWVKLKDEVLRGWVECSDGRLYHPVVSEQVRSAWDAKLDQRWRTECARIKKHADRHKMNLPRPTFDDWLSQGCPQGQRLPVPRDSSETGGGQIGETHSKGEGERQGERQGQGEGERQGQGDSVVGAAGADSLPPPPAAEAAATTRGTRIKPDWLLPRAWGDWALAKYPHWTVEGVRDIALKFQNHWKAKSGKDATKVDWYATWQNWCMSEITQRENPAPRVDGRGGPTSEQQLAASLAKADRILMAMSATNGAVQVAAQAQELMDG